ncbi:hypothetical protein C8Z91_20480 [Paenibacillus elgii]|uniref:Spore coat protein B n=1 Tax=Paenibacillus elgii TaxID=189691 RepID=A0A2T6FZQ9_9BACL|nr:hypothetical protein [Paenibacillus elgii]PUA37399.1 hypothetical protein C8Z91_20480 [Paenibacillus elgii]
MVENSTFKSLIGSEVKINRGGHDAITGKLIGVHSNYVALSSEDGAVYVNTTHVKSISQSPNQKSSGTNGSITTHIKASSFNALLHELRHNFVKINRGGPEKLEGIISDVTSDHAIVIINNELIRVPLFHIKSVTVGLKSRGNKNGNKNGNKSRNTNGNAIAKSGGNKSSKSNRSGNRTNRSDRSNRSQRSHRSSRSSNRDRGSQGFNFWTPPFFS